MKEKPVSQQANELIELAMFLGPEDEGMDLTDQDYELADLVTLKNRLSGIYKAITVVNAALADYWIRIHTGDEYTTEHDRYYVSGTKEVQWMDDDSPFGFAEWLKEQDVSTIVKVVSLKGLRRSAMPKVIQDTFINTSRYSKRKSIRKAQ